jgi:hypothetical protein
MATNGHGLTQAEPAETVNVKSIVQTLEALMTRVTAEDCTPQTVNAACNCSARITDLLRLHLDAQRLQIQQRKKGERG